MEVTKDERLALLAAMDRRLSPTLKEAKNEARCDLMERHAEDGTDRKAILVGGEKVGEVGISYSKASPYIYQERVADALEFLREKGLTDEAPKKGWEQQFELVGGSVVYKPSGEIVDWAGWNTQQAKTAVVRGCAPEDVLRAFGAQLPGVDVAGLLEGDM